MHWSTILLLTVLAYELISGKTLYLIPPNDKKDPSDF